MFVGANIVKNKSESKSQLKVPPDTVTAGWC